MEERYLLARLDQEMRFTAVDDAVCAALGTAREGLLGAPYPIAVHPDDAAGVREACARASAPPYYALFSHRALSDDGWHWLSIEISAPENDPARHGFRLIGRDVTHFKLSELQLRAQRDLAVGLGTVAKMELALPICLDIAIRISGMDAGGIYVIDPRTGALDLASARGLSPEFIESTRHWPADSDHAKIVGQGLPIYSRYPRVALSESEPSAPEDLDAIAILPIVHQGAVIGCFNLASHRLGEVPAETRSTLEAMAAQVGQFIARIQAEEAYRESQSELRTLFDTLQDFLFVLDAQGTIVAVNDVVLQRLGYEESDLIGNTVLMVHPPESADEVRQVVGEMVAGSRDVCTLSLVRKDGVRIPVETRITMGHWAGADAIIGVSRDVSERIRAESELRALNESLQSSLDEVSRHSKEVALLSDMVSMLQLCRHAEEAGTIVRLHMARVFEGESGALFISDADTGITTTEFSWGEEHPGGSFDPRDCWVLRRGRAILCERGSLQPSCPHLLSPAPETSICVPLREGDDAIGVLHVHAGPDGMPPSRQQFVQTVAESLALAFANLRLRDSLHNQAMRDPLTSLFNRRYLEETLPREAERASRSRRPLALMLIDADRFKEINDTEGHDAGDEVLRVLAGQIASHTRLGDIACRYGGDEFVIVLPETEMDDAVCVAEKLRHAFAERAPRYGSGESNHATLSIGVASFPEHGHTADQLLRAADHALYDAKRTGRDQICRADVS